RPWLFSFRDVGSRHGCPTNKGSAHGSYKGRKSYSHKDAVRCGKIRHLRTSSGLGRVLRGKGDVGSVLTGDACPEDTRAKHHPTANIERANGRDSRNPKWGRKWGRIFGHCQELFGVNALAKITGGQGGIRTHEPRKGSPHFECGAINHSTTCPCSKINNLGMACPSSRGLLPPD